MRSRRAVLRVAMSAPSARLMVARMLAKSVRGFTASIEHPRIDLEGARKSLPSISRQRYIGARRVMASIAVAREQPELLLSANKTA
jgi:hypothetical protein